MYHQGEFRDDTQRALRADEKVAERVSTARLAGLTAQPEYPAVGENDLHTKNLIPEASVFEGIRSAGVGAGHPAHGGVGPGIDGEEQSVLSQPVVQLLTPRPCLDRHRHALRVDGDYAVHSRQVE